jgi:ABC-type nitrate/sulfonate/bicarbonate transport system substrate-binding protein
MLMAVVAAACGGDDSGGASGAAVDASSPPTGSNGSGSESESGDLPKIVFSGVSPNAYNWPQQICAVDGMNICSQFGIEMEMIYSASSPAALAALFGGSVQATSALYSAAAPLYLENPELVYIMSGYDRTLQALVVSPEITSVDQLEGKTCGSANPPQVAPYLQVLIEDASNGELTYPDDFDIIQTSGSSLSAIAAAFESGAIDCTAAVIGQDTQLEGLGLRVLVEPGDAEAMRTLPLFGINMTKSYVEEHEDLVVKFIQGQLASIAWLENPDNKEAAIDLLMRNSGGSRESAEASYEIVTSGGFPRKGLIKSDALERTLDVGHRYGDMAENITLDALDGMIDLQYVKEAYETLPDEVKCLKYMPEAVPEEDQPDCAQLYDSF